MGDQRLELLKLDSAGAVTENETVSLPAARIRSLVQGPDGNLYVAINTGRFGVGIYTPAGVEIGFIPTPGAATNVAFGLGSDNQSLYITAATGLYRMRVNRRGYNPS